MNIGCANVSSSLEWTTCTFPSLSAYHIVAGPSLLAFKLCKEEFGSTEIY